MQAGAWTEKIHRKTEAQPHGHETYRDKQVHRKTDSQTKRETYRMVDTHNDR